MEEMTWRDRMKHALGRMIDHCECEYPNALIEDQERKLRLDTSTEDRGADHVVPTL